MSMWRRVLWLGGMAAVLTPAIAQTASISQAYADKSGSVKIVMSDGKTVLVPKEHGATGADNVRIAPDGRTVGWLATWPNPEPDRSWEVLPSTLIIWRDGEIVHKFQTDLTFYAWSFWKGSAQVAYRTGPMHGPAPNYELHDIATGRLLQHFLDDDNADAAKLPEWVKELK